MLSHQFFCMKNNEQRGSGIRDLGSGKKPFLDPGSRGQKGTGSRIRIRNTVLKYQYHESSQFSFWCSPVYFGLYPKLKT
jgi:hypothetical protein